MSGSFTVNTQEGKPYAVMGDSDYSKFVTVSFSEPKTNTSDLVVYLPVPAQTYGKLMLSVEGTNGSKSMSKYMITKDTKVVDGSTVANSISIPRNSLYKLKFVDNFKGAEIAVATETYDDEDGRY